MLFAAVLATVFAAAPSAAHGLDVGVDRHAAHHGGQYADLHDAGAVDHRSLSAHVDHGHADNCDSAACVPFFLPEGGVGIHYSQPSSATAEIPDSPAGNPPPPPVRPPRSAA